MDDRQRAIMEAEMIYTEDCYFHARPQMDSDHNRIIFSSGYQRGYEYQQKEIESLRAKLAEAEKDAERLRGLRELCGYVQDGSNTSVHISQDDATRSWHLSIGPLKPGQKWWYAETFDGVIDAAIAKGEE